MTTNTETDALLAAEYVLGLVDESTRLQLEQRAAVDDDFAKQIIHWQKAFSVIDRATESVEPPAEVWHGIERELNRSVPTNMHSPRWLQPTAWLGWAMAAVLAGVLLFTYVNKPVETAPMQPIAVLNSTHPGEQFVISTNPSASLIQVSALNVTLPESKNLQLWLIKGNAPPRSLGLITHPQHNEFRVDKKEDLGAQTVFAISLEPVGGSTLAGPSGPVIFQGKMTPVM